LTLLANRNPSVIITLDQNAEEQTPESIAQKWIGKNVYAGWPFLHEAIVESVSDELFKYERTSQGHISKTPHDNHSINQFTDASEGIEQRYSKRFGTMIGPVEVLLNVRMLEGMSLLHDGSLQKCFSKKPTPFPFQLLVHGEQYEDPRFKVGCCRY
jgi:5'-3' exoribonuclease 1